MQIPIVETLPEFIPLRFQYETKNHMLWTTSLVVSYQNIL